MHACARETLHEVPAWVNAFNFYIAGMKANAYHADKQNRSQISFFSGNQLNLVVFNITVVVVDVVGGAFLIV